MILVWPLSACLWKSILFFFGLAGLDRNSGLFLVFGLPFARVLEEALDFGQRIFREGLLGAGLFEDIPPCAEVMQGNAVISERFGGLGENVVVEDHRCVGTGCACFADRVDKGEL